MDESTDIQNEDEITIGIISLIMRDYLAGVGSPLTGHLLFFLHIKAYWDR